MCVHYFLIVFLWVSYRMWCLICALAFPLIIYLFRTLATHKWKVNLFQKSQNFPTKLGYSVCFYEVFSKILWLILTCEWIISRSDVPEPYETCLSLSSLPTHTDVRPGLSILPFPSLDHARPDVITNLHDDTRIIKGDHSCRKFFIFLEPPNKKCKQDVQIIDTFSFCLL